MSETPNKSLIGWIVTSLGIGATAGTALGDKLINLITNRDHTHTEYALKSDQVSCEGARWVDDGDGVQRLVE